MNSDRVHIELQPMGEAFEVARGTPLQDVLFAHGVEFPCGGKARCKGCRVRVVAGELPVTPEQRQMLSEAELNAGWRLACCSQADSDLVLDIAQWEETILADDSPFAFTPADGLGVAVDVGTTTLVAQLLDRRTGRVLAVETAHNPQAVHGSDLMSRVQYAVDETGRRTLCRLIRDEIGRMIGQLLQTARSASPNPCGTGATPVGFQGLGVDTTPLAQVVLVGNTVMHHLFCGLSVAPLAGVPFETPHEGRQIFTAAQLGWKDIHGNPAVEFLPCLGSFVGSDLLAGILAARLHENTELVGLVDLGTNGEIVIGNGERMLCASTAAGPAFEGAQVSMGMRAITGAISAVRVQSGVLDCHVIGNVSPRGLCGSGLVDAIAAGLELGTILPTGRLAHNEKDFPLAGPVRIIQADIRELQLAKAAIAAGIRILLERWPAAPTDLSRLYIAGAFGNYINLDSARRIGLIDFPASRVHIAGNTALLGAKLALFAEPADARDYAEIRRRVQHVALAADARFMDAYVEAMPFPSR